MADKGTDTRLVIVKFTLDSSKPFPYSIDGCAGSIYFVDRSLPPRTFSGWDPVNVGTPQSSGADFILLVHDTKFDPGTNPTSVGNYAMTFIPYGDPTGVPGSPFSNQNSLPGSGAVLSGNGQDFVLDFKGAKIQKRGAKFSWDWSLLVQIVLADKTTRHDFVSDPQMDVDPLTISDDELRELEKRLWRRRTKKPAPARTVAKKKKSSRRR